MEQLTNHEENLKRAFSIKLFGVATVAEMFPPDDPAGVREPRRPVPPQLIGCKMLELNSLGLPVVR